MSQAAAVSTSDSEGFMTRYGLTFLSAHLSLNTSQDTPSLEADFIIRVLMFQLMSDRGLHHQMRNIGGFSWDIRRIFEPL